MRPILTTVFLYFLFVYLPPLSNSKSIIKNLPGFDGDLPFTFETGYVGIGDDDAIQIFYYFVESQRNPSKDPLLLYLTGGPGTSGLYDFLYEYGPLSIVFENSTWTNITFELNQNSWTKVASIIFVDLPAGVGFSYAKTPEASRTSDSGLALQVYDFIKKWLTENTRFLNNPLYISGSSYMGIIVPTATLEAYKGNERGNKLELNIKGCICVSPLTDKFNDITSRLEFSRRLAIITDDIYEYTKETCHGNYLDVDPNNFLCLENLLHVNACTSRLNGENVLDPLCDTVNPKPTCREAARIYLENWANHEVVWKALHVRERTVETWQKNNDSFAYEYNINETAYYSYDISSSIIYHKQLIARNSQVLIINGDHDMIWPYVGTEKWIRALNLPLESPWKPWFVGKQVAGYRMTYAKDEYSLTYATIKGAGHGVALYKPKEALAIVDGWITSHTYLSDS